MDKIVPAFETSLFDTSLSDVCVEIAELGIDSILDNDVLKSLPICNLLVGVGKTAQNIYDRNLLKQTIKFINTFNKKSIPQKKLEKYKKRLNDNSKYAEKELGRVIVLLNSNIDLKKSELLGKFYASYVNEEIKWEQFCELSDITSRLFLSDLSTLYNIYNREIVVTAQFQTYIADRLIALGVINSEINFKEKETRNVMDRQIIRSVQVSRCGELFCKISLS